MTTSSNVINFAQTGTLSEVVARTAGKAADDLPSASKRAFALDMRYLATWFGLAFPDREWILPADEAVIQEFYAHHLFKIEDRKGTDPIGMPEQVEAGMRTAGFFEGGKFPPTYSTFKRRIASWRKAHNLAGVEHCFDRPVTREVQKLLMTKVSRQTRRKSKLAISVYELTSMLETCSDSLQGARDRALLMMMYASGGRRRSEPGKIKVEDLSFEEVPEDPRHPHGPRILACRILLPKTKTVDEGYEVAAVGEPAFALRRWLSAAGLQQGPLFPRLHVLKAGRRKGDEAEVFINHKEKKGLSGVAVANIVKQRLRLAGFDDADYSAHGIRAGFMTDSQASGIPLADAMQQSTHKSAAQAMRYYNAGSVMAGSARLLAKPADVKS